MAASNRRRLVPEDDPLRIKLDQLAEAAIDRVLAKGDDATLREITETLKTVSAYRSATRSGGSQPESDAWSKYRDAMMNGRGKAANAASH